MDNKFPIQDNGFRSDAFRVLHQIDFLKRFFVMKDGSPITAKMIFGAARVRESYANAVLHGKKVARPTLAKLDKVVTNLRHSSKIKSRGI